MDLLLKRYMLSKLPVGGCFMNHVGVQHILLGPISKLSTADKYVLQKLVLNTLLYAFGRN